MIRNIDIGSGFIFEEHKDSEAITGYSIDIDEYCNGVIIIFKTDNEKVVLPPINAEAIYLSQTDEKFYLNHFLADTEVEIPLEPWLTKDIVIKYNESDSYIYIEVEFLIPTIIKGYNIDKNQITRIAKY